MPSAERPPHVRVVHDALEIDGRRTFLYGGEVQYFRVRDRDFDAARTLRLWSERLDQLRDAGANFVTTYVPWDYHERSPGRLDFGGARALRRFLETAAEKGCWLCVKPGPHILAEWPYGFGSWGGIPAWWKRRHRRELVVDFRGEVFRWHPFFPSIGPGYNTLPSYASEQFRIDTERWYAAVLEEIRPLLGPGRPIVAIQLDNETNSYWSDAYRVDFHPAALARFRARLRAKYGAIDALSAAYGRRFASFDDVRAPHKGVGARAAHEDWFDHQHALVGEWLASCRAAWGRLGVNEPDVMFLTNDTHQTFPARDLILPNGPVKNRHGLHALDTYPRCFPLPRRRRTIYDRPYEPDAANKLIDVYNDIYLGPSRFTMGIEVQGGHFQIPFRRRTFQPHKVTPESTTQTYLRLIAHGMKALSIYIAVGGFNIDGTSYAFQAAIAHDGALHPRYAGVRAVGRLISAHEAELLESEAVESRAAILACARALGPGYGRTGEQRIYGDEIRACFGWFANAGFTPRVLDVELASDADLAACRALLFPSSGNFGELAAGKLERFTAGGGTLIQALDPGPLARSLFAGAEEMPAPRRPLSLLALFGRGPASFQVAGAAGFVDVPIRGVPRWRLPPRASRVLFVPDEEPLALGFARDVGSGQSGSGHAIFLGTLPTGVYATPALFTEPAPALNARALFLRRLMRLAGESRLFAFDDVREECHARRVPSTGALLLFVFTFHEAGKTIVRLRNLDALGLDAGGRYAVEEIFGAEGTRALGPGARTGAALREEGIALDLGLNGATVVRVRPA